VVGAGAAGLLAALFAARAGADVVLLESTKDGGRKILISGGGRCNILPSVPRFDDYGTDSSPHSLRRLLRSWPLDEQRAFFERELEMPLELEPETGKLFPSSHRARDVRDGLVRRVREAGARIWFDARVTALDAGPTRGWRLETATGGGLAARRVVLATGGRSVPATGSRGWGLEVASALGHTVHPTYPALTPLTAHPHPHAQLAGVSLEARIEAPGTDFRTTDGFLVTHRGWSGPAVLDASHLAVRGRPEGGRQELTVSWTPTIEDRRWDRELQEGAGSVRTALAERLPRSLVDRLLEEAEVARDTSLAQLRREERARVVEHLTAYRLPWTGDEGYKKAEVTGGGVALEEVDPTTLESRVVPDLYLCGELLDAFGPIGGHNFLWAWATGRSAGTGAARSMGTG